MAKKAQRNRKAKQERINRVLEANREITEIAQRQSAALVQTVAKARLLAVQAFPHLRGEPTKAVDHMINSQMAMVPCPTCPRDEHGQQPAIPSGDHWYSNPVEWPPMCDACRNARAAEQDPERFKRLMADPEARIELTRVSTGGGQEQEQEQGRGRQARGER